MFKHEQFIYSYQFHIVEILKRGSLLIGMDMISVCYLLV